MAFGKEEGEKTQAKFNMGLAELEEIHNQRRYINFFRLERNPEGIWLCLLSMRSIVDGRLKPEEREQANAHQKKIVTAMIGKSWRDFHGDVVIKQGDVVGTIYNYELWFSSILKGHGLGMPDDDDDEGL